MRDLQPEALRRLTKTAFERFCRCLLEQEYEARFEGGAVDIAGGDEDLADGGRDLWVRVTTPPLTLDHWSLLPNVPSEAWYSCKSHKDDGKHKDPGGWRKQVREDLDPSPNRIVDGKTGELLAEAETIADGKLKRPPRALLEALAQGGQFVVLVNVGAELRPEFEAELRTLFGFWIRHLLGTEPELTDAVRVCDAHYLARAFNRRPFTLSPELREQLEVDEPEHLLDWQHWTDEFQRDRRAMTYRGDALREQIAAQLRSTLESNERAAVFRIWGPPGVGKTRLVHHVLGERGVQPRVRFSQHVSKVRNWLTSGDQRVPTEQILVVDEVPPIEAAALARDFTAVAPARARLIIIGPLDHAHQGAPQPSLLDRLDPASTRAILVDEMGAADERIDAVLGLCRGFPLFAMWLGRALAEDPELLRDPGRNLSNDDDPWDACCAVLAGPRSRHTDHATWYAEAERRGKAIILVSLTTESAWSRFDAAAEAELAEALESTWPELRRAANDCESRSLVRRVEGSELRYVSPANLERMVLNHFFAGGPGRPPLDPRRLVRSVPHFVPNLLARARLVEASDACQRNLSEAVLAELRAGDPTPPAELAPSLWWVALLSPADAVEGIKELFERSGLEAVAASPLAAAIRRSLVHAAGREVTAETFETIEAMLFALTRDFESRVLLGAEPQQLGEADYIAWMPLFVPAFHQTRRPFAERFAILQRRLGSRDARERMLATAALGEVIDWRGNGWMGWDDVDGPWEWLRQPTPDYQPRFEALWSALLEATSDPNDEIAAIARSAVARRLRARLPTGPFTGLTVTHIERLTTSVATWHANQRDRLAKTLDEIQRSDRELLAQRPSLATALAQLCERLQPTSLGERLIAQIGRWHPGPWPINADDRRQLEQQADTELARAFVSTPERLTEHLAWLVSDEAVRGRHFARALGRVDPAMQLFPVLRRATSEFAGYRFVAGYLLGWAEAVGDVRFDQWLQSARASEPAALLVLTLALVSGTDQRARLLAELVGQPDVPSEALVELGSLAVRTNAVSLAAIDNLLIALARRADVLGSQAAMELVAERLSRSSEPLRDETRATIHNLLVQTSARSLPSVVALAWTKSVLALARQGDLEPLAAALHQVTEPEHVGYPHHLVETLQELAGTGLADLAWPSLANLLDDEAAGWTLVQLLEDSRFLDAISPELVRAWINDDRRREALIERLSHAQREAG
jgi:hypothetical protein